MYAPKKALTENLPFDVLLSAIFHILQHSRQKEA